jgi:hypothetical protein
MARVAAGAFGFLIFSHAFDGPDLYGESSFLWNDALKAELTNGFEHLAAIAFGVFDALNTATGALKHFAQHGLTLCKRLPANVVAIVHQDVKSEGCCCRVIDPTMQGIELRNAIWVEPNDFSIENGRALNVRGALHNQRIAL